MIRYQLNYSFLLPSINAIFGQIIVLLEQTLREFFKVFESNLLQHALVFSSQFISKNIG